MSFQLTMYNYFLLASVESLMNIYLVSLAQRTFDCSSNAITTVRILRFTYIRKYRCFLSYDSISGQRLHNILSPEMKFHFV